MKEMKGYKEELVAMAILIILFLTVRWMGLHAWSAQSAVDPVTGITTDIPSQYDVRSELETIVWTVLRMVIYSLCAWLGLRITMPLAYRWFKRSFAFDVLSGQEKLNLCIRWFAIFFFGLVALHMSGATTRECVIASAAADLGVRELTGHNDGERIEEYQAHVHAPKRSSYCVAFVSFHLDACGVANPRSAWSPSYSGSGVGERVWTARKAVRAPLPADVFTLYFPNLGRVGHGGFVERTDGRYILTIEANTNGGGSRDGDGVYRRRRELRKLYAVTNYIHDESPITGAVRTTGARKLQAQATQPAGGHAGQHHGQNGIARHAHLSTGRHSDAQGIRALSGCKAGEAQGWPCNGDRRGAQRRTYRGLRVRHSSDPSYAMGSLDHAYPRKDQYGHTDRGKGGDPDLVLATAGKHRRSGSLETQTLHPLLTHG
jgi:hypothetical protein